MPVAPRVLNKIHDKVQAGMHAAGGLKLALFKRGLAVKREGLKRKKRSFFFLVVAYGMLIFLLVVIFFGGRLPPRMLIFLLVR